MLSNLKKRLDLLAISAANKLSQHGVSQPGQLAIAAELLAHPNYLNLQSSAQFEPKFHGANGGFTFETPERSPWAENNIGYGRFYKSAGNWRVAPTLILLHGWNAELCYRHLFPYIAGRARKRGFNTLLFELPLHSQRRPRTVGAVKDWISDDLLAMLGATRQALLEIEAITCWLKNQGSPQVITWGLSLGAWLAGLHLCHSTRSDAAVLATPVARMDLVVNTLSFCAPVRNALKNQPFDFSQLNLRTHVPRIARENILLVESIHDQFAPPETIEDLKLKWDGCELWRVSHGHISLIFSLPIIERTLVWLEKRFKSGV